jgi:membrane protease YdiL (CAAX protease family)
VRQRTRKFTAGVISLVGLPTEESHDFSRGRRSKSVLGAAGAVTVASICFAWFHAWPLTFVSPPFVGALAYYVVMGIVFGLAYEMTDNLTVPFAVHGLFNAGPYAIALLTVI